MSEIGDTSSFKFLTVKIELKMNGNWIFIERFTLKYMKIFNFIFDFKLQHWVISMLSICKDFNRSLYLQEV